MDDAPDTDAPESDAPLAPLGADPRSTPEPGRAIWERLPRETGKAWAAFEAWRDLGPGRALATVGSERYKLDKHGQPQTGRLRDWARIYAWHQRAQAWDRHLADVRVNAQVAAATEMGTRHARIAHGLVEKAWEGIQAADPGTMSPQALVAWAEVGVKLERLARSEDPEIQRDVQRLLAQVDTQAAESRDPETQRRIELDRMDWMIKALLPAAVAGDPPSIERFIKLSERRAKLLGLDAPERSESTRFEVNIIEQAIANPDAAHYAHAFLASIAGTNAVIDAGGIRVLPESRIVDAGPPPALAVGEVDGPGGGADSADGGERAAAPREVGTVFEVVPGLVPQLASGRPGDFSIL